ncbi:hypothetical protein RGUI_2023 [Rhodovulum sp. P5]|nr:hypothetical protein RGUI_2023 [Rhodovulum sp. P5]
MIHCCHGKLEPGQLDNVEFHLARPPCGRYPVYIPNMHRSAARVVNGGRSILD